MARPHIEFIHTQQLPWRKNVCRSLPDVECKMLSRDDETGACSMLLRYPAGWQQDGVLYFEVDEEFYVLDGDLKINDQEYGLDCFAYLPAGYDRSTASTDKGCDVIAFYNSEPTAVNGAPVAGAFDLSASIPFINAHDMSWNCDGMDPYYGEWGMQWKMLNHDPATNAATVLVSVPPQVHPEGWKGPREIHDCMEEAFILGGDLHTHNGVFHNGMYFYRPPGIYHGPFASRFGSIMLVRVDGVLENNWTQEETPVSLYPEHKPVLPDDLAAVASEPWHPGPRY